MESFPNCPVCKKEVLIPLSAVYGDKRKTLAHWICLRCGFYFGTGGSAGYEVPKDIRIMLLEDIPKKVRMCSEAYEKSVGKGHFTE